MSEPITEQLGTLVSIIEGLKGVEHKGMQIGKHISLTVRCIKYRGLSPLAPQITDTDTTLRPVRQLADLKQCSIKAEYRILCVQLLPDIKDP